MASRNFFDVLADGDGDDGVVAVKAPVATKEVAQPAKETSSNNRGGNRGPRNEYPRRGGAVSRPSSGGDGQ
jgi:hypothetical protein